MYQGAAPSSSVAIADSDVNLGDTKRRPKLHVKVATVSHLSHVRCTQRRSSADSSKEECTEAGQTIAAIALRTAAVPYIDLRNPIG